MREHPGFWVACRNPEALLDPLTLSVPGLGEALAVFCFEEEAMLYLGYGDDGLRPCPVGPDELMVLLFGRWSRFELVTLDPMPQKHAGVMLRLASMRSDDFLDRLAGYRGPGRQIFNVGSSPNVGRTSGSRPPTSRSTSRRAGAGG